MSRRLVLSLDEHDVRSLLSAVRVFELSVHATANVVASLFGGEVARLGEGKGKTSDTIRKLRGTFECWLRSGE